jgi:hypothetical protein
MESLDSASGTYVYAVVRSDHAVEYGSVGLDGAEVVRIGDADMAALTSTIIRTKVRPERRHLAAHNAVLRRALSERAVLPMQFGLIAESAEGVREMLAKNRQILQEQLDHVDGKVEMGLRVRYDVPNVFEYFLNRNPELREARDAMGDFRQPRHADMIALGQLFDRLLSAERERHTEQVSSVLERHGIEVKQSPPRAESELMNLACLMARDRQAGFEDIVSEAATDFDNNYLFDISGPWAPHHFVELVLAT